jgi:hypothetical protein
MKTTTGNAITFNQKPDKPVFIWMTDLENTSDKMIGLMDSISQVKNNKFNLCLLPVIKEKNSEVLNLLVEIATKLKFDHVIEPIIVKNNLLPANHPVLSWLSDKNNNKHFEIKQISNYSQFLLIGKDGTLKGHIAEANKLQPSFVPLIINRFVSQ